MKNISLETITDTVNDSFKGLPGTSFGRERPIQADGNRYANS